MRRASVYLALSLLLIPATALAHGGEDHSEKRPAANVAERAPSASGMGDLFEALIKYTPAPAGKPTELKVFIADARTNEPVSGAEVELTFTGKGEFKATPTATSSAGIYVASVRFPSEGDFDAVASVSRGEEVDLIALGAVRAGIPPEAVPPHEHSVSPWWMALAGVGVLLVSSVTFVLIRSFRARRRRQEVSNA